MVKGEGNEDEVNSKNCFDNSCLGEGKHWIYLIIIMGRVEVFIWQN